MRIVVDTNILVRAAKRTNNPAREVLRLIRSGPHFLIASRFLLAEVEKVLHYPRVRNQHRLSDEEMIEFLSGLYELAEVVDLPPQVIAISTDPDDDVIIQTAVVGRAEVLCTLDRHIRNPRTKARSYCRRQGIEVMTDIELLNVLRESRQP